MILYRHDSSPIFTTAQICNPSIYKTTTQPPKKMNQISVLTKTEVSHSTSSISSMASEWWWFVFWWAVWPRRIVKLCHTGCCGTNHNVIVSFFCETFNTQYPSIFCCCYLFWGARKLFWRCRAKKTARLFKSSLNCLQVGLSGAVHQSLVSNSRRVEVQLPLLEASNLVLYFFGRLLWKKKQASRLFTICQIVQSLIVLQGEIAAAYTMDRERDMDFGWVSWFERLKFQMILFIAFKRMWQLLFGWRNSWTVELSFFCFFGEWIMMLRSHFLIMTSHLWLYFLGWFHTDICYSLLSTSLLLDQLWSTEVCYGRLLFYTSQSVPWHGFFNVLHLKPSMGHLWRRNTKVCSMMFPWKIGILKVPSQLKKIYYMHVHMIYIFPKKIAFLWGHCFYGLFHPWHVPGWEILCGQKETDQEDSMNYPAILPHSTWQKLEI